MMHGTNDFAALLGLLAALPTSPLTAAERADAIAVAREHFHVQAHDPRLSAIVDRITAPAPEPVATPVEPPAPRQRPKRA